MPNVPSEEGIFRVTMEATGTASRGLSQAEAAVVVIAGTCQGTVSTVEEWDIGRENVRKREV